MPNKLALRPSLEIPVLEMSTSIESFQNQTLRPILKLQNDLYLALFKAYIDRKKTDFSTLRKEQKSIYIEQSLQKDVALKNIFIGVTVGMFTLEELEQYNVDPKEFNRRIITMLMERIRRQRQRFVKNRREDPVSTDEKILMKKNLVACKNH